MIILDQIKAFVKNRENQDIYKYIGIYILAILAIMAGFIFWHYKSVTSLKQQLTKLSEERRATQQILTNYQTLQQQENELEDILAKNKDFRIMEAYNALISNLNLSTHVTGTPDPIEERADRYIERKLPINLDNISTEQLVKLLDEVQKYDRLYTKDLTITNKAPKNAAIDATLVIATLEPINETT